MPRADDEQPVDAAQRGRGVGHRPRVLADVEQGPNGGGVRTLAAEPSRQRHPDDEGREVADRVAPALVLLLGLHHEVGKLGARGSAADGDQRGLRAGVAGGAHRLVRGTRAALVRDGDQDGVGRRSTDDLQGRYDLDATRAGSFDCFVEERGEPHRRVLGGPHPGRDHAAPGSGRVPDGAGHRAEDVVGGQAVQKSLGERRLRRDHLAHQVRRACRGMRASSTAPTARVRREAARFDGG